MSIPLLLIVSALVFLLQWMAPGDAAESLAGPGATREQVAQLRHSLDLDEPAHVQYMNWLGDAAHGDLGRSLINGESVTSTLGQRLPVTFALVTLATLLSAAVGLALGLASSRGGKVTRQVMDVVSIVGFAVPSFWLGLVLVSIFSVRLGLLPANGYTRFADSPQEWIDSLALPVASLGLAGATTVAKQSRDALADAMSQPFIRNLRANGFHERSVLYRHALRTASLPVVTVVALLFISALGGAVVVESVFGLPGLGGLAVSSASRHDIPMIQGVAVYFTLLVIGMNLLLDIAYGWLNPKVRVSR